MTITADAIATAINVDLNRSETATTLERHIQDVLEDIGARAKWHDLHTSATLSLATAGAWYAAMPTGLRIVDRMVVTDPVDSEEYPVEFEDWEALLDQHGREDTGAQDRPKYYCRRGATIYFRPAADQAYTVTVYYWREHPDHGEAGGILFGNHFKKAIVEGVKAAYLHGTGMALDPKYAAAVASFEHEIAKLIAAGGRAVVEIKQGKYTDI